MRALIQRVTRSSVTIGGDVTGAINAGLVILLGIHVNDAVAEGELLASKVANLRIFTDADSKFNLSALDVKAEMLVVSQFTLYADTRRGRRPGFTDAARPETAIPLYEHFVAHLRALGFTVATGEFGADMLVEIHNDGPVTIWLDTDEWKR